MRNDRERLRRERIMLDRSETVGNLSTEPDIFRPDIPTKTAVEVCRDIGSFCGKSIDLQIDSVLSDNARLTSALAASAAVEQQAALV